MKLNKILMAAGLSVGLTASAFAQSSFDNLFEFNSYDEDAPGSYVAGIWVDPDGCQHWVMDLGIEGMMDSVMNTDGTPVCGRGCGRLPGEVLFNTGSAQLTASGREAVQGVAAQLASRGQYSVGVVGYTDSRGSESANQALSQARANAVANELSASGVSVTSATGRGEANPIGDNGTDSGRAANRRVELVCQ